MEWAEELVTRLRVLWDEGRSTAEIGRNIGMSKNAVVGKAHRLDLPARPSPIRRDPGAGPSRPRAPARGPTLPPLAAVRADAGRAPLPARPDPPTNLSPPRDLPGAAGAVRLASPPAASGAPRPHAREMACCWPLGEPGTAGFHFCGEAALPGKPYCARHAQLAYVRVRDRRDDAA
ncbi:MAG: GcrA cell cycle regulator [Rhodospirillales bacterium]|nr:GcrA cell cycle regulator [Rhodospirillales bacterium]